MSSIPNGLLVSQLFNLLRNLGVAVKIPTDFPAKMELVNDLLSNDYTGIVNPVLEFMIHSGSVDFNFETKNPEIRKVLLNWKKTVNMGIASDIPRGLKSLTAQYLRERFSSSFIGVKVVWQKKGKYIVPSKVWLVDGKEIKVDGNSTKLGGYTYTLGKSDLKSSENTTVIIRKPFNSWYDKWPDPYLVKQGTLYNALLKKELLKKQGDVLEAIIPYMLLVKAGNESLDKIYGASKEEDLNKLVDEIKKIKDDYDERISSKGTIGGFSHDVSFEHLLPDLTKFFSEQIIKPIDRNIFASLGLIELEGFSSNRQEAILNPKVLVEGIKDAVCDLNLIYEDIILEFIAKNKLEDEVTVIPGKIKAFITDSMRILARSAYDRGIVSRQTFDEDYMELNFEVEVNRIDLERRRNLPQRLFPPVIMNQDSNSTPDAEGRPENIKEKSPEKKKTEKDIEAKCQNQFCDSVLIFSKELEDTDQVECPECREIHLVADLKENLIMAPYNNINDLPESVRKNLPVQAQHIFMAAFNSALKQGHNEETAFKIAWSAVKKSYKKVNNRWIKKASVEETLDAECLKCHKEFDYSITRESGMGYINCPHCQEVLTDKDIKFKEN